MAKEKAQWSAKFDLIGTTTVRNGKFAVAFKLEVLQDGRIVYAVFSPDEAIEHGRQLVELGERLKNANAKRSAGT